MKPKNLPGSWVLESFRRGGVDLTVLTQQLPVDVHLMLYEMNTILPDRIERLLQACAQISGEQDFGLKMNEHADLSMYGLLGYLLLNSGTVDDLFETLVRYHSVHHDGGIFYKTITQDETISIRFYYDNEKYAYNRHTTDWGLGFIPLFLKPKLAELAQPLSAQFVYDKPDNTHKLEQYFGSNLEFNQAHNQLIYPRSILQQQITEIDLGLLKILRAEADKCLLGLKKESQFYKEIKIILFNNLAINKINATDIAHALNISLSTFKRKLNEEGIDFKQTKDTMKNDIAMKLLTKTDISITEIAQRTGFKNPSSFTRFFIRYNNQKPLAYRKIFKS
jgi:AraC-like DNA-binding protein